MKLLLDTQIIIWIWDQPNKVRGKSRRMLDDLKNELFVSALSFYEIGLKRALGKLDFKYDLELAARHESYNLLDLNFNHCQRAANLPLHHRDPFDRLIIAQSIEERIPLITSDKQIHQYDFEFIPH